MTTNLERHTLYHHPLSPASREVRLVLGEKKLFAEMQVIEEWKDEKLFVEMNPVGSLPILVELNRTTLCEAPAICEYLEEVHPTISVLPRTPLERAEVRRLCHIVRHSLFMEAIGPIVFEKFLRQQYKMGTPDVKIMRQSLAQLKHHLQYFEWLTDQRRWLAGEFFSLADLVLAAHLSVLDFLGQMHWADILCVKDWYARVKSRPSFRPLLEDHVGGVRPPLHYTDLDF